MPLIIWNEPRPHYSHFGNPHKSNLYSRFGMMPQQSPKSSQGMQLR